MIAGIADIARNQEKQVRGLEDRQLTSHQTAAADPHWDLNATGGQPLAIIRQWPY